MVFICRRCRAGAPSLTIGGMRDFFKRPPPAIEYVFVQCYSDDVARGPPLNVGRVKDSFECPQHTIEYL